MPLLIADVKLDDPDALVHGTQRICIDVDAELSEKTEIVLVPQPTSNPDDPLNYSWPEKQAILWTVAIFAGVVSMLGPMVATSYIKVAVEFDKSLDQVTQALSGTFGLTVGVGTLLTGAFGTIYGKRPAFIISLVALIGMTFWCYAAKTLSMLAIARSFEGFAASGIEIMASSVVADLFFVHQRARQLAIVGSLHGIGILSSQIAGGFVVQHLGWRWLFFLSAILLAASIIPVIFLLTETNYSRPRVAQPVITTNVFTESKQAKALAADVLQIGNNGATGTRTPYLQRLYLWNRARFANQSFWKIAFRPLPLLAFPAVIFGAFVHGLGTVYLHAFSYVKLELFSKAPYNLTPSQVGLTAIPGLVFGLLGQAIGGYLSDYLATRLAKANKGIYEPEFRLWLMIPQAIFSTVGFIGFGITISRGVPLPFVLACYANVTFSVAFGSLASMAYLMDSMPSIDVVQEAIVSVVFLKSIFNLLFASKMNGWILHYGVERVFITLGLANLFISMCTIPFYVQGKRLRHWSTTNPFLKKLV